MSLLSKSRLSVIFIITGDHIVLFLRVRFIIWAFLFGFRNLVKIRLNDWYSFEEFLIRIALIGLIDLIFGGVLLEALLLYFFEPSLQGVKKFVLVSGDPTDFVVTRDDRLNHIQIEVLVDSEEHTIDDTPEVFVLYMQDPTRPGEVRDKCHHDLFLWLLNSLIYVFD